jgi:hypothetical protein
MAAFMRPDGDAVAIVWDDGEGGITLVERHILGAIEIDNVPDDWILLGDNPEGSSS